MLVLCKCLDKVCLKNVAKTFLKNNFVKQSSKFDFLGY